jgi:hypothetical protein
VIDGIRVGVEVSDAGRTLLSAAFDFALRCCCVGRKPGSNGIWLRAFLVAGETTSTSKTANKMSAPYDGRRLTNDSLERIFHLRNNIGMAWEVEFTAEFEDWWNSISEDEQVEVSAKVELLHLVLMPTSLRCRGTRT